MVRISLTGWVEQQHSDVNSLVLLRKSEYLFVSYLDAFWVGQLNAMYGKEQIQQHCWQRKSKMRSTNIVLIKNVPKAVIQFNIGPGHEP